MKEMVTEHRAEYMKQYRSDNAKHIKQYAIDNKEKMAECKRQYYIDNKEKITKNMKQYQAGNKEKKAEYDKKYREDNKEKHVARDKKRREDNKENKAEYDKKYRETNSEERRVNEQRREAIKKSLISDFTVEQWESCLVYFDHKDAYTGLPMDISSQDHVIPLSKGGGYTVSNIVPCECSINSSKGNRDMLTWFRKQTFYDIERENKILAYLTKNTSGYRLT